MQLSIAGVLCLGGLISFAPLTLAEELYDPTTPADFFASGEKGLDETNTAKPLLPGQLLLNAVFIKENNRTAVINNTLVHEGDEIQGKVVQQIRDNSVLLERDGTEQEINILSQDIREPKNE